MTGAGRTFAEVSLSMGTNPIMSYPMLMRGSDSLLAISSPSSDEPMIIDGCLQCLLRRFLIVSEVMVSRPMYVNTNSTPNSTAIII